MPFWGNRHRRGAKSASGPAATDDDIVARLHDSTLQLPAGLSTTFDVTPTLYHTRDNGSSTVDQRRSTIRPAHFRSMSVPFSQAYEIRPSREPTRNSPPEIDRNHNDRSRMRRQSAMPNSRSSVMGPNDLTSGTCMTCGGTMRWPKDLKVFKCTICATVNDLLHTQSSPGRGAHMQACTFHGDADRAQVTSLTVQQTKQVIHQSIRSYLCRRLVVDPVLETGANCDTGAIYWDFSTCDSPIGHSAHSPRLYLDAPTLDVPTKQRSTTTRAYSSSHLGRPSLANGHRTNLQNHHRTESDEVRRIFKPLEDYIAACFSSFDCVNTAFSSRPAPRQTEVTTETVRRKPVPTRDPPAVPVARRPGDSKAYRDPSIDGPELDPKLLLLGDVGENGMWWTGDTSDALPSKGSAPGHSTGHTASALTSSPQIHRDELSKWFHAVINAAEDWFTVYEELGQDLTLKPHTELDLRNMEADLLQAQDHAQRHLMKVCEVLLKRPSRPLLNPEDIRFLLILLENPLLYTGASFFKGLLQPALARSPASGDFQEPLSGVLAGQHSGIIKRIVGLMSNSSPDCHHQLISWLSRYNSSQFARCKDLVSVFLAYRMRRQRSKKQNPGEVDITGGLIPEMRSGRIAYLHDEIGRSQASKKHKEKEKMTSYSDDWQIKAAARVLGLFFAANNYSSDKRSNGLSTLPSDGSEILPPRESGRVAGQIVPTSDFYLSMIDYSVDLVSDFEVWTTKRGKFAFCQYPFLLSIRAKTDILEHDAQRQMQSKARDALLDSIMSRRDVNQYFTLNVRRDCLVDDSLKAVSEVVGSGGDDAKKALRVTFRGEEGIDAGGLRKEWFLMLIREVFNPDHGMFTYDDDSQFCYFNPNSFETSDQFFLVGVVIGLAIYNSTILDVALPTFVFRKLLASMPAHGAGSSAHPRPAMKYTLEDLATYQPQVAKGLRQLLDFDGDVESVFGLTFTIGVDKYGTTMQVPLCHGGDWKAVTNANRREYVDLYVIYVLDISVKRQFEPFKRGFYTVCGGNAFSLFRPEEIEMLVRGSDQPLDIPTLRGVATYDNWDKRPADGKEPVVSWFWETFEEASVSEQRKLLFFITGSDRIPATGASTLSIRLSCLGNESTRYPIARTCFNSLSLFQYETKEKLEYMVWRAVHESEGFGLK